MTARAWTLLAAVIGATATLLVSVLPFIRFAYRSPFLHVVMETGEAVIALVVAYLVFGRFQASGERRYLLLTYAFAVLGLANLSLAAVPTVISGARGEDFSTWAPLISRLVGTSALVASALVVERRVSHPERTTLRLILACAATLLVIAALVVALTPVLPPLLEGIVAAEESQRPRVVGQNATLVAVQIVTFLAYAAAALGFTRRAEETGDELMNWLAAGTVLAAFARLNYLLFPSLYTSYVYTGDFLRLGFYLLLMVGAAREISAYWRSLAEARVDAERARLARILHDGLAQELVFIAAETHRLRRAAPEDRLGRLAGATDRAVAEARRAMSVLTRSLGRTLAEDLAETAQEMVGPGPIVVDLQLDPHVEVSPVQKEELLRIAREALTNAVRHAEPSRISVQLQDDEGVRLVVTDDGAGFDEQAARESQGRESFGMMMMQERARSLGAELTIATGPGNGTAVEIFLPANKVEVGGLPR